MNKTIDYAKLNKILLAALLVVVISLCFAFTAISFAAYTHSSRAQRTISADDNGGDMFSSNYLIKYTDDSNMRTLYVTNASVRPSAAVTVCNYRQGMSTKAFERDITYTLTCELVYYDSDHYEEVDSSDDYLTSNSYEGVDYQIEISDGVHTVILGETGNDTGVFVLFDSSTFSGTLTHGDADSDVFSVIFGTGFAPNEPNLYLRLTVTPSIAELPTLIGLFAAGIRAEGASNNWLGYFSDNDETAPYLYDGFNYVITGTGAGTFTLKWNSQKIALSYQSILMLNEEVDTSDTYYSITIDVDSDTVSRYDLQFYKVNIKDESWATDMNSDIAAGSPTVVRYSYAGSGA